MAADSESRMIALVELRPEWSQAGWEEQLARAGFGSIDARLRNVGYVNREFPTTVPADQIAEFVIWANDQPDRTMSDVAAAMLEEGISPASAAHAPAAAQELPDGYKILMPQISTNLDSPYCPYIAFIERQGDFKSFGLEWTVSWAEKRVGTLYLGVRTILPSTS